MDLFNNFSLHFLSFGAFWYLAIFIISLLESLVVIGLIVPGTVFLLFVGFLLTKGFLNIPLIILMAFLGAILGDIISYFLGKKGTRFFKKGNRVLKIANLEKGKSFFKRHGRKSIFLGRFTGPLRSLAPFIAGTFSMDFKKFLFWNILSGFLWSILYLFLGFSFGEAWQIAENYSNRAQIIITFLILFLIVIYLINLYFSSKEVKFSVRVFNFFADFAKETFLKTSIVNKYPNFFNFFAARFKRKNFFGLPFTLLSIAFFYVLFLFFGFVKNFILSGTIYGLDIRIENLLYVFRDDELIKFFCWITLLANWQIIVSFGIILSIIFWILRKRAYIFALWIAVIGTQLFDTLGKIAFARPRPQSAIFIESSNSFPSGHSAIAIAFYGFIAYVLLRTREGRRKKLNVLSIAFVIIFFIGFSRTYLGLHYFSDIIGGYLLGFLWLIISISIFEWSVYKQKLKKVLVIPFSLKSKRTILSLLLVELVFYVSFALNYQQPFNFKSTSVVNIVTNNALSEYKKNSLPKYSETLRGNRQEPMSFLILAKNDNELVKFFKKSAWYEADYFNRYSLLKLVETSALNKSYLTGPVTPSFWNSNVHDLSFQKPTPKNTIRERHHVRFWKTNIFTIFGKRLYVGTASYDTRIKWLITHKIDPNIDAEREYLFKDLLKSGMILDYQKIQLVGKTTGRNFAGDAFYTDGKAYLIELN